VTAVQASALAGFATAAAITVGIGVIVGGRALATSAFPGAGLSIGVLFGLALLALAARRPERPTPRPVALGIAGGVALGIAGGVALVALALLGRFATASSTAGVPALGLGAPAALFVAWAGVTALVATAEELVLRGSLFDALAPRGIAAAVVVTSLVFALMHVPAYGWRVVPLDIGVGLFLGGLRLVSGGVVAPAVAHTLADLATWWL
jgi:membrane protease YdiL (CAAX protease family)